MTERNATESDTCEPQMTRDRTSRLNSSVPNGCASDGAMFFSATMFGCALHSYGTTCFAATAIAPRTASTTAPAIALRSRPSVRSAVRHGECPAWLPPSLGSRKGTPFIDVMLLARDSARAHAWVGHGVQQI